MISANDSTERACAVALQSMAIYMQQIASDPTITLDNKMKMLQWIYKKIPEVNRLLIYIKTREISNGQRN